MAEFLIQAQTHWMEAAGVPADPEKLAAYQARSQKGDVVIVKPDGWAWGAAEGLPDYVVAKVPTLSDAPALAYQARVWSTADPPVLLQKYRWRITGDAVDAIVAAGGVGTLTTTQFLDAVRDKA